MSIIGTLHYGFYLTILRHCWCEEFNNSEALRKRRLDSP